MSNARRCPECRAPLASRRHGIVELDACTACGGIWFDATELSTVLLGPRGRPHPYSVRFSETSLRPIGSARQTCPGCGVDALSRAVWGSVVAAKCRGCQGIWLSSRDLPLLRRQLAALQESPPDGSGPAMNPSVSGWEVGIELLILLLDVL